MPGAENKRPLWADVPRTKKRVEPSMGMGAAPWVVVAFAVLVVFATVMLIKAA